MTGTPSRGSRAATLRLVAELYYVRQLGMKEIAGIIGQSTATVSRMLSQARDSGMVRITVEPVGIGLEERSSRLSERLGVECTILPGHVADSVGASRHLGAESATLVANRIPRRGIVGLAAGHTVHALIGSLPPMDRSEVELTPVIGGYHPVHPHLDTNALVRTAASHLGSRSRSLLAPASVDSPAAREALLNEPMIREISTAWDAMDTAIFSTSAPASVSAPGFSVMETVRGRRREDLIARGMVGDVVGHLFDITGTFSGGEWSAQLIAMTLDQVRAVRQRIVLIAGSDKGPSALGLARTGMATWLILDETAAQSVERLMDDPDQERAFRPRVPGAT